MADEFFDNVPFRAQKIGPSIDQIEFSLGHIKNVFQSICSWHDDTLTDITVGNRGLVALRPKLIYKDADEIYLNAMVLHHAGTTDQMVYSAAQLTYQLGSGGSNAGSEDLDAGAVEWQYLYIDDSVLVTDSTNVVDETRILNSNESPSWDATRWGWYPSAAGTYVQTTDRCIGAVLINASNQVMEFWHDGDLLLWGDSTEARAQSDLDDSWEEVTLAVPTFTKKCRVNFEIQVGTTTEEAELLYRTEGSDLDGYVVAQTEYYAGVSSDMFNTMDVIASATNKIEIKMSVSDTHLAGVFLDGFYYPIGM